MGYRIVAVDEHRQPLPPQDEPPQDELEADSAEPSDEEPSVELVSLTDNVGEQSVEINVEGLIAEIEAESRQPAVVGTPGRRRLDDFLEERRIARQLEDLEDFEV